MQIQNKPRNDHRTPSQLIIKPTATPKQDTLSEEALLGHAKPLQRVVAQQLVLGLLIEPRVVLDQIARPRLAQREGIVRAEHHTVHAHNIRHEIQRALIVHQRVHPELAKEVARVQPPGEEIGAALVPVRNATCALK